MRFGNGIIAKSGGMTKEYLQMLSTIDPSSTCAVLLGDIHNRQEYTFKDKPPHIRICYSGSLVSQNIGEGHKNHGWIEWTLNGSTIEIINHDVPNMYAPLTIHIRDGEDITEKPIPTNPCQVRVRYSGTLTDDQRVTLIDQVKRKYAIDLHDIKSIDRTVSLDGSTRDDASISESLK